jgi:site-specific recombinase XerD
MSDVRETGDTGEATVDRPVEYFLQDMEYYGRSDRTRGAYRRVLEDFAAFLESRSESLETATNRDCMAWIHRQRGSGAESTVATYAAYLHRFYTYMNSVEAFDTNPMTLVMEELDESIETDPTRRDVSVPEMRAFVRGVTHPLDRAVVVTLLKTGVRVGELSNLDLRDLRLTTGAAAEYDLSGRAQLTGRGDSLFVSSEPTRGQVTNGERREDSNKRKRSTVVPVDAELAAVLTEWLAVRPDTVSPAEPLFVRTRDHWGTRLSAKAARRIVVTHAREAGWHRSGGGSDENVTPHYFRHFFTTHMRDRTGDRGIVKYLRGDVAGDVIDTYTHNWGDRVRETYERHVYSLC